MPPLKAVSRYESRIGSKLPWTGPSPSSTSNITGACSRPRPMRPAGRFCSRCWRKKKPRSLRPKPKPSRKPSPAPHCRSALARQVFSSFLFSGLAQLVCRGPFPPMRRPHGQPLFRSGFHPAAGDPPAGKHQSMRAFLIDDGESKVPVKRRAGDDLPHR